MSAKARARFQPVWVNELSSAGLPLMSTPDALIHRVPHSRRYHVTDTGLQHALLFTHAHAHDHLLRTGLAEITDPDPPAPSRLRTAVATRGRPI